MIYYDEHPEELTLEYWKKIMEKTKTYTLKYFCSNCNKEKYLHFKKGIEAPSHWNDPFKKEICEKCECDKFYKAAFQ